MGYASWYGQPYGGVNFDFNGGILNTSYQSRSMNFSTTNGEICDKNGNLLFYTNGVRIANSQDNVMQNGNGLNPAYYTNQTYHDSLGLSISQANLIIPFPDDTSKFYLFHETIDDYGNSNCTFYLYYSIIDMTMDSGLGAVVQKNVVLLDDSLVDGRLAACKHANGRDWWLICHHFNSIKYYKYLITPGGIQGPFTQDVGSVHGIYIGQCVFSPDGSKLAYYEVGRNLDIFNFDRCTGDISLIDSTFINDGALGGGIAFSPNSKILYASSMNSVYQFDMNSADILASRITVATWDGYYSPNPPFAANFFLSELAPDGKIYINCGNSTMDIHVINNPDSLGLACSVCQHCIHLPAFNAFTIPNHPNYFLGADSGSICDSLVSISTLQVAVGSSFKIYPNPIINIHEITITYPSLGNKSFVVINNTEGKEVTRCELPQWSSIQHLTLPKLSTGVYIARFLNAKFESNVKFVVE